jgi:uncharacterized protein YecT (DUF1311 family)
MKRSFLNAVSMLFAVFWAAVSTGYTQSDDASRLSVSGTVAALFQTSGQYNTCIKVAQTQFEMNKCASEEAARADAELTALDKSLLAEMNGDHVAIAKAKEAERSWIRYRDAYIEAMFPAADKQAEYGTEYPMDVDILSAKLTREHQAAIADLKVHYQPPL